MGIRKYINVSCKECGVSWDKRKDTISDWNGRCNNCARKEVVHRPEIRAKLVASGKKVREKYGQIPNGNRFKKGNSGELSHSWKGGKPKCYDCGKQLKSYCAKRCVKCDAKKRVGQERPIEYIEKMRLIAKKGDQHWNWNGGSSGENILIRMSSLYKQWRKEVFKRDNYTCQECGLRSRSGTKVVLNADHIKPFSLHPELRFELSNGKTLCQECHKQTETFGWNLTNKKRASSK